ncbi:restriction endonuclease subunit S [Nitrosovibrio tenuis]|uniref:Type I restriction enzyme, S subunit n=1 Tax=Nitrosovibrio tenuis TaxID=1233 RepID=A0A1H7P5P1_9PROT|nr:restriction endonuclease subunit S [Nitrosovibrio tenuis]SEL30764.1 type I restriction enzyme, S subunit [Nitrosovibrio tenuis]
MSAPQLRFKDEDGRLQPDWCENTLLNLSENGFTNGVFNDPNKTGRGYKLVNVLDMYIDSTIDEKRLFLVELSEAEFKKNKVEHGEIFFTRSSLVKEGIAYSNVYLGHSQDITFDGHLIRMSPRKNVLNSIFANYLLRTSKVRKQLVARGKTATMTTIGQADIAAVMVAFPSLDEQTKIANFLTVVDEKISQLTQKYELLAQYKKGVIQQIFSQELRFKDDEGREFPEWKERKLKDVAQIVGGGTPKTGVKEYWGGNIQWFTPTELKTKYVTYSRRTITEAGFKNSSAKILPAGTILFSSRATVGDVSIASNECTTNQGFQSLLVNKENNNVFIYYWILNNKMLFLEKASGSTFMEISKKEIEKLPIAAPTLAEQAKIANFLTAIDDKITATQIQLDAAKQYKQGLLQQMFV